MDLLELNAQGEYIGPMSGRGRHAPKNPKDTKEGTARCNLMLPYGNCFEKIASATGGV